MTAPAPDAADPPVPPRPSRTRQIVSGLLTLAVLAFVFLGLFPQLADLESVLSAIESMSAASLWIVAIAIFVNIAVYPWPFPASLPGLRYWPAFEVRQTAFAVSNTVPAGGALGLGLQYAMLGSYGFAGPPSATAIAVTSTWNAYLTLLLPVAGLLLLAATGNMQEQWIGPTVVAVLLALASIILFAAILRSERAAHRIGALADRIAAAGLRLVRRADTATDLESAIVAFRGDIVEVVRRRWIPVTASNLLMQLTSFAILYAALAGLEGGAAATSVAVAFACFTLARLLTFVPITPGGLGTVDAALVGLLTTFGTSNADAVAAVLIWRVGALVPQVILGGITFLTWRARSGRLAQARAAG